jgi:hypothetical protein
MTPFIRIRPRHRRARKSVTPLPTDQLMEPLFKWLKLDEEAKSYRAMKAFWDVAGPSMRARARAERLRGSTLFIRVASSGWAQQLGMMRAQLIERVRARRGGAGITDLRFSTGPLDASPEWGEDAPAAPIVVALQVVAPPVPEIDQALARLPDGELRDCLASLLQSHARFEVALKGKHHG